ncbi:MAG: SpoIIE family protein phosphatase [Rhodocyclaceae bacterium]
MRFATSSLRSRFLLLTTLIFLLLGVAAMLVFERIAEPIAFHLGTVLAEKQVLYDQAKIGGLLSREIALARKLTDSPLLRDWAENENNPATRRLALSELESYRSLFRDQSYFFVIRSSLHYYFNDKDNSHAGKELNYTLELDNPRDVWFESTLKSGKPFQLNVDNDAVLNVLKVWINTLIYNDAHEVIGVAGSGIDISDFRRDFLSAGSAGMTRMLIDEKGSIQAHPRTELIDQNTGSKADDAHSSIFQLIDSAEERQRLRETFSRLAAGKDTVATLPLFIEGHKSLVGVAHLKELDWFILTVMDTENLVPRAAFLPLGALLLVSLLLTIALVLWLLNRLIISRIERMDSAAREVARGNYAIDLPVIANDEIGRLSGEFNHMAGALRDYTERMEEKVAERTAALAEANRQLSEVNAKVHESIAYASLIQSSLLPPVGDFAGSAGKLATLWRPRDTVGGDFILAEQAGDCWCIALLDCTGHGMPGALMTMVGDSVVRRAIAEQGTGQPEQLAQAIDKLLREALNRTDTPSGFDHGMDIGLMIFNPSARSLLFVGGGIDLYLMQEGKLTCCKGGRKGVGYARRRPSTFDVNELQLKTGDRIFMSSDGLFDQSGGDAGYGFGRSRFATQLCETATLALDAQLAELEAALLAYQNNHLQRDDIAVVGLMVT